MIRNHHLVKSIQKSNTSFVLNCISSIEQYEDIDKIICKGEQILECCFLKTGTAADTVTYEVTFPAHLTNKGAFFALLKDGTEKRVWKPAPELHPVSIPNGFYFENRYMNLSYTVEKNVGTIFEDPSHFESVLTEIKHCDGKIHLSGFLFLPTADFDLESVRLIIIEFRRKDIEFIYDLFLNPAHGKILDLFSREDYRKFYHKSVFSFKCVIDLDGMKRSKGHFNIFIEHKKRIAAPHNHYLKLAAKNHCYPVKLSMFRRVLFVPYYYEAYNSWRLDIYHLSWWEWLKLRILFRRYAKKSLKKDDNIWLIGDRISTASDNGMHFFNYMQKKHPEINTYYVIARYSDQLCNLKGKNIVFDGSYEHFKISAKAGTLVFSQLPDYLVPKLDSIVGYRGYYSKFNTIFLQHGVIATTAIAMIYAKSRRRFNRFVVSSEVEKNIITNHLGYDEKDVIVTGLSRWDNLYKKQRKTTDILVMPTWRENLTKEDEDAFVQTDYYQFWNNLLTDDRFLSFLKNNNLRVKFFLHAELSKFTNCFDFHNIIEKATGKDIQELLSNCGLLVTDYSSVAFDVLFQNKPVIFCPFDLEEMRSLRKGSEFIDYENDLPGPLCYDTAAAVLEIIEHVELNFSLKKKYRSRRKQFFKYIDASNCDRVYKEIKSLLEERSNNS